VADPSMLAGLRVSGRKREHAEEERPGEQDSSDQ